MGQPSENRRDEDGPSSSSSSSPEASSDARGKIYFQAATCHGQEKPLLFPEFFNGTQESFYLLSLFFSLSEICSLDADVAGRTTNPLTDSPMLRNDWSREEPDYHHRDGIDLFSTAFLAVCRTCSAYERPKIRYNDGGRKQQRPRFVVFSNNFSPSRLCKFVITSSQP